MYAVIKTGGKQYRVKEGDLLDVEKLGVAQGATVLFDRVLLIEDGDKVLVGTPVVAGAAVKAEVVENFKGEKVLVFKKKRRKQYRRTKGHRQELAKVRIAAIYPDASLVPPDELKAAPAPAPAPPAPKKPAARPAPKAATPSEKKAKTPAAAPKKAAEKAKAPAKAKPAAKPKKAKE